MLGKWAMFWFKMCWSNVRFERPRQDRNLTHLFSGTNGEYQTGKEERGRFGDVSNNQIYSCRNNCVLHQYIVHFVLQVQLKTGWSVRCSVYVYLSAEAGLCCWICQDVVCSFCGKWIRPKWTESSVWLYRSINLQETVFRNCNVILMFSSFCCKH